ncbi:trypsin domain-containing protein [Ditylenchus destructor]|uniref:Trypsin domain-containing protein n=1 Tax=Ditylenchus destructor TaxID=166010 RepID=A0AAD4MH68_9BILA|nr:trypsin domain-containing protein [Ditylenchus destructor]
MAILRIFSVLFCLFLWAKIGFSDLNCGISSSGIPPHAQVRIVNGHNISAGDHPWLVHISIGCGGSIVSNRWILTAAHCNDDDRLTRKSVMFGTVNKTDQEAAWKSIKIQRGFSHPTWDPKYRTGLDIALGELSKRLPEFDDKIQPICLVKQYEEVYHSLAVVIGWGSYTGEGGPPGKEPQPTIAQETTVPIGKVSECGREGQKEYDICAGALQRGTEQVDSGGPLLVNKDGRWWQIGAVSRGGYLGSDWHNVTDLGLYSRVAKACPWIEETTKGEVKCQDFQF